MTTEDDLSFKENRQFSPQWIVEAKGQPVAVVTERYISSPPFCIRWLDNQGAEVGPDELFEDRDTVMARLLEKLNSP